MRIGRLVIRSDSSPAMGTGHVMRMIALGQAWRERGGTVLLAGEVGPLAARLAREGFAHVPVPRPHPDPADLEALLALTDGEDWIVLDGYHFDTAYQHGVRSPGRRTLVLDDVADRGRYEADFLLNQNADAAHYAYATNPECRRLLDTRYALLRREFWADEPARPVPAGPGLRLLVTFGGSDPRHLTGPALAAIAALDDPDLNVTVVAGAANTELTAIERRLRALPGPAELLDNVADMRTVMHRADLALTAAGSTCWELCRLGVPMLAVQIADNQAGVRVGLEAAGAAVCLDSDAEADNIGAALRGLLADRERLAAMGAAGRRLVDGRGAQRVADRLAAADLVLTRATAADGGLLLAWRNHPEVRRQSFSGAEIDPAEHARWFAEKLRDARCVPYIARDRAGRPVGQIRFDIRDDGAYISLSTDPALRGRGIGTAMTEAACARLRTTHPGVRAVALVKPDNPGSAAMFRKAGFALVRTERDERGEYLRYEL